jgi:hypothetical protein
MFCHLFFFSFFEACVSTYNFHGFCAFLVCCPLAGASSTIGSIEYLCFASNHQTSYLFVECERKKDVTNICPLIQGQLQIWTEHSTLIFENLKPVEKSKIILASIEHLQKLYLFSKLGG